MLFDDIDLPKRKGAALRALPPVPKTGWKAPDFPNLSGARAIALDVETYDPDLTTAGPGWARGRGHIVGASLAAIDHVGNTGKWYFPIRHTVEPETNLEPANVLAFLKHTLENPYTLKIGAHLLYDLGWLTEENIYVQGELHDIQFGEALIDNNARVGLDVLATKYLGEHKESDELKEWITKAYKPKKSAWRGDIYRAPPRLVGPYGESDADLPLRIWQAQAPIIERENLEYLYRLENDLIPLYIMMRQKGVRVNVEKAYLLKQELEGEVNDLYDHIRDEYGFDLESIDSRQVGKLLDRVGISYPRTKPTKSYPNGNPSIDKEWLADLDHPLGQIIHDIREREKINGTFIQSYILDKNVNGILHPQFHPLRGESNGTLVGRYSSSDPNLQNIPSRTELGKRVRECFEPYKGHYGWRKLDYSQIHYRILAHNAVDNGDGSAEALRERYRNDPDTDYHQDVLFNVAPLMGWDTSDDEHNKFVRRPIKNVNFGLLYGQTEKSLRKKTAAYFGSSFTEEQAKGFFDAYHRAAPYVKATMDAIEAEATANGYVETVLGRRIRMPLWEPFDNYRRQAIPLPKDQAVKHYGSFIRLAFAYRSINYKFQGSEPDIMKEGLRKCWRSGVFEVTGVPALTVHDELDWSQMDDSPETLEAFRFIQETMANAVKLSVPVKVDASEGPNWGKAD